MMMLDSTVLIDLLRGTDSAKKALSLINDETTLFTSEISVSEVILGCFGKGKTEQKRSIAQAEILFDNFEVLPLDHNAAIKAGEIAGELKIKGRPIEMMDCMIAGIARTNGISTVLTRNKEHFERIPGIKVKTY